MLNRLQMTHHIDKQKQRQISHTQTSNTVAFVLRTGDSPL